VSSSLGSSLRLQKSARRPSRSEPAVALTLLHGFRLEARGADVALPLGSQRLVAFLAVHRRPLQRLFVAGSLWLECDEERASASLRTALWRVQRLGFPLLDATRNQLSLARSVTVDLHESDARTRALIHDDDQVQPLDDALLDGEVLADWYDDWVMLERERYRQMRLHALEAICRKLVEGGAYARAIEVGLACVAAEPLRESAHRALISAHCAQGNVVEAARQYALLRRLLADQLGIEPSEATKRSAAHLPAL
jgi:DNA-binding SARP family transcriptional activator